MDNILTKKQELVLRLIKQYYLENGTAPSLGELQHNLGISTKRGVGGQDLLGGLGHDGEHHVADAEHRDPGHGRQDPLHRPTTDRKSVV